MTKFGSVVRKNRYQIAAVIISILALLAIVLTVPHLIDHRLQGDEGRRWRFWIQLAAGNWSSNEKELLANRVISDLEFATSAVCAVLLNNFLIFVLLGFMWRLITERNKIMEATDALALNEAFAKEALRASLKRIFRDIIAKGVNVLNNENKMDTNINRIVDEAYREGHDELVLTLNDIIKDKDELKDILEFIENRRKKQERIRQSFSDSSKSG